MRNKTTTACDFLLTALKGQDRAVGDVTEEGKLIGIRPATLRLAMRLLGVRSEPHPVTGRWMLSLPKGAKMPEARKPQLLSGDDVVTIRETLGISQAQLSTLLGYRSPMSVYLIEAGQQRIPEAHARLLLAYQDGYRPHDWPA